MKRKEFYQFPKDPIIAVLKSLKTSDKEEKKILKHATRCSADVLHEVDGTPQCHRLS